MTSIWPFKAEFVQKLDSISIAGCGVIQQVPQHAYFFECLFLLGEGYQDLESNPFVVANQTGSSVDITWDAQRDSCWGEKGREYVHCVFGQPDCRISAPPKLVVDMVATVFETVS